MARYISKANQRWSLQLTIGHREHDVRQQERWAARGHGRPGEVEAARERLAAAEAALVAWDAANPPRAPGRKFAAGRVKVVDCASCGTPTTSGIGGSNLELCRPCYALATWENHHNDEGHEDDLDSCPECGPLYRAEAGLPAREPARSADDAVPLPVGAKMHGGRLLVLED